MRRAAWHVAAGLLGIAGLAAQELRLDEPGIRRAMRAEIIARVRRLAEGGPTTRDFHTLQAWAAVRGLLDEGRDGGESPAQSLSRLADMPASDPLVAEFQGALNDFARGMTIEILDSLAFEWDETVGHLGQMLKLEALLDELAAQPPDPARLRRQMRRRGIPRRLVDRVRRLEESWREPEAAASCWERFSALKRSATGLPAPPELDVLFALGEAHRQDSPFLADFVAQYEGLCRRLREAAARLRPRLVPYADVVQ